MKFNVTKKNENKKGVYKITNIKNKQFYIGSTRESFKKRFSKHVSEYKNGKNNCLILKLAFEKYNINNFKFEILEIINIESNILKREEFYIKKLNPKYNICKYPTFGGKPNLNKKLTVNWKNKIAYKASLYKHSKRTLKKVTKNNKINACRLLFSKKDKCLIFTSWKKAANFFNIEVSSLRSNYNTYKLFRNYKITILKTQKKKIKVYFKNKTVIFNSFNSCDRYLKRWRGYTSTSILNNRLLLEKYKYKIL